jgi:hypothetical protein
MGGNFSRSSPRKRSLSEGGGWHTASLAPLAGRGPHGNAENQNSGLVRGRFDRLRLAEAPPHPTFSPHGGEKE